MTDFTLTQAEADTLIAMEKHRVTDERAEFPMAGESVVARLQSADKREQFLLDLSRSSINLKKIKLQTRRQQVVVLVRLDLGGAPHRNPDGEEIPVPHLHIYREGYGDKWAMPVPMTQFRAADDTWMTFEDFLSYCNITRPPYIDWGLFT